MSQARSAGVSARAYDPSWKGRVTLPLATALVATLMLVGERPRVRAAGEMHRGQDEVHVEEGHRPAQVRGSGRDARQADRSQRRRLHDKVVGKFDGGIDPAKGCFEKLESKTPNDCITLDDTAAAEAAVDSCVAAFVEAIDPAPITQTKCGAGKKKCVSKLLAALLKCHQLAQTPGKSTDPNANGCVDKATAKYTGGADPAKGCFAKLEAKSPNDCQLHGRLGDAPGPGRGLRMRSSPPR